MIVIYKFEVEWVFICTVSKHRLYVCSARGPPFINAIYFGQKVNSCTVTVWEDLLKIILALEHE